MTHSVVDTERWLRTLCPAPQAPVELICFPYAGGSASYFYPFATALAPRAEVRAVQYPGRQDRIMEPCVPSIPELVECIVAALADTTVRPFAFFGHSMGALATS